MRKLIFIYTIFCISKYSYSQCNLQVTHTSGTKILNSISIDVSSTGIVDTSTTYCENTFPYVIGFNWIPDNGPGRYNFSFSPVIDSLTINFSGLSSGNLNENETVLLYINGLHYSIPNKGMLNGCDVMADLTPTGDITSCNCGFSGWNGTTIRGNISSLSVLDSPSFGGSLFSLFIPGDRFGINKQENNESILHPNPLTDLVTITLDNNIPCSIILFDMQGKNCLQETFINTATLNTKQLKSGIYFYEITNSKGMIRTGKIIRQ
jgi:hypothetical protein